MRVNRHLLPLSIALGLLAVMCVPANLGCKRTKAPYDVSADPYAPQQVYVADRRLSNRLRYQEPQIARDEAGLLHVTLGVRVADNRPQIVQYRTRFFDETGQQLHVGDWRTVTLESNVYETLQATSTTPRAADFQMDIRTAR